MKQTSLFNQHGKSLGQGTLLVVYAPFGTDEQLSTFPDGAAINAIDHPLVASLCKVAAAGTHVVLLMDRVDDDSWLIEIQAGELSPTQLSTYWKIQMSSPRALAGLLRLAHSRNESASIVLAIEGHGAGYLPEIDRRLLTPSNVTNGGKFEWQYSDKEAAPILPAGFPVLPAGFPVLPAGFPVLPVNHLPLSTYGLGRALKMASEAGVPKLAAIHFANCFNMSTEVLHTVAPYADFATGYNNYNFFTAGASYPKVFERLASAGRASVEQLAQWFADEQHSDLVVKGGHPIAAGVVELSRMEGIAKGIDALSDTLLAAMRGASPSERPEVVGMIQKAIEAAQQYDSEPGWELETPDQLTDICSLAARLYDIATDYPAIQAAAMNLVGLMEGIKRHGDSGVPWLDDTGKVVWDFTEKTLAMNIFLPDPLRTGQWDWRSTYYVDVNPDPSGPRVQPGVIDFLKVTNWVEFLVEYHRDVPFKSFHVGSIPLLPRSNPKSEYKPPRADLPKRPRIRWPLGTIGMRIADWLKKDGG